MEYCHYGDLGRFLKENGPLSEGEAKQLTHQILEGLDQMHQQNFAHRDLKPGNVLIKSMPPNKQWWLVLSDFGFSKRAGASTNVTTGIKGTDTYMAPELLQFLPENRPTTISDFKAADIWALGEITYGMITGTAAFPGPVELIEYCRSQRQFPSERLPDCISATVHDYIKGTMSVLPQDRMTSNDCLHHDWMKTHSSIERSSVKHNEHNLSRTGVVPIAEPDSARWSNLSSRISDRTTGPLPSTRRGSRSNSSVTQVASSVGETTTAGTQPATHAINETSSIYHYPSRLFNMTLVNSFGLEVKEVTISPDGKLLAFHHGVSMVIMNVSSGKMKRKFKTPKCYNLTFSPDSQYLVAEHRNGGSWIEVYSSVSGTSLFATKKPTLAYIMGALTTSTRLKRFAISPDSKLVAWGWNSTVTVMRLSTGEMLKKFWDAGDIGILDALAFSPDGKWLTVTIGGLVKACDITSLKGTNTLWRNFAGVVFEHGSSFQIQISFSPTGDYLVVSSNYTYADSPPGSLYMWNFATGAPVSVSSGGKDEAIAKQNIVHPWEHLIWSPRDSEMVALSKKGVRVANVSTCKVERTIEISLGLSKTGELIISPAMNLLGIVTAKEIQLWDIESWKLVQTIDRGTEYWRPAWIIADGQRLIVQHLHKFEVWKIDRG